MILNMGIIQNAFQTNECNKYVKYKLTEKSYFYSSYREIDVSFQQVLKDPHSENGAKTASFQNEPLVTLSTNKQDGYKHEPVILYNSVDVFFGKIRINFNFDSLVQ